MRSRRWGSSTSCLPDRQDGPVFATRETPVHRDPDATSERVTSLALGEEVFVVETDGAWTRVLAPDQPTHLDRAGYPGWAASADLGVDPLAVARGLLGTPYLWGGLGRDG